MPIPVHVNRPPSPPANTPWFFSYGFRVFFLAASVWAALAVAILVAGLIGGIAPATARPLIAWHAHEMLFGFAGAGVAGFLLTAVPAWTGQPRLQGWPLAGLLALWIAGRALTTLGGGLPQALIAAVDVAFLATVVAICARSIVIAGNKRNLPVIVLVVVLVAACLLSHVASAAGSAEGEAAAARLGMYGLAFLIVVIGGRIVPNFTGNWMARTGRTGEPAPFGPIDQATLAVTAAASLADVGWPQSPAAGALLLAAAALNLIRVARWQGHRTLGDPLVWVLHLGYLWLVVGYAHLGLAAFVDAVPRLAGIHALSAGAIATMLLAVMSRASLGHTGRPLVAGPLTVSCYLLITLAALARLAAAWAPAYWMEMLGLSAAAWIAAFALFAIRYAPIWFGPRVS